MFENIIGHRNIITSLTESVINRNLAPAMLFHGPRYSGKLSCALELARVLLCDNGKGEWQCRCSSCERQRLLINPNMLLLGSRNFDSEILSSADAYIKTKKSSTRYLFIRSVRKLLKQYDTVLWEGEEQKIKTIRPITLQIEELLSTINMGKDKFDENKKNDIKKITELCIKISSTSKSDNIPINQVRRASFWAHISTQGTRKIIIFENADKMLDSSRNSLLKILEEPPPEVFIVLLATRKGALIKTILSRVRPYYFRERLDEDKEKILKKIFHEESGEYKNLHDYFIAWRKLNPATLKSLAQRFIDLVIKNDNDVLEMQREMEELLSRETDKYAIYLFVEELFNLLRAGLNNSDYIKIGLSRIKKWSVLLRGAILDFEIFNINRMNIIESLYYKMKVAV